MEGVLGWAAHRREGRQQRLVCCGYGIGEEEKIRLGWDLDQVVRICWDYDRLLGFGI